MISCLSIGIIKKLLYETQKRKKKHAIIDFNISHEECKTIINEKKDYDDHKNIINEDDKGKISEEVLV